MTDTQPMAPTDAEIWQLWVPMARKGVADPVDFARAVLAKWGSQPVGAQPAPQQEAASVDPKTMELAESVGLIGPASRTHDLHAAVQRFHDLICVNATIKAAVMAADAIRGAATSARDYPPLPMQFACSGVFPVYSADQMRAYVDADRASHGQAQAAPQPSPTSQGDALDAARLDWLESQSQVNIERVRYLGADTTIYEVTSFNSTDYNGETLRKAIDAARAAHQKGETP